MSETGSIESNQEGSSETAPLHALGGKRGPSELAAHLVKILELTEPARTDFWRVFEPSLAEPIEPRVEESLSRFCGQHGLDPEGFGLAVKASRFLFRAAARNNVNRDRFGEDLDALSGSSPAVRELLLGGFDRAMGQLRREILRGTLADHGKLLTAIDWRLDRMICSDRGEQLGVSVVVLTLHYREGSKEERISLQLLPENLATLRSVCDRLIPG
jgi:hypothetical protein